jgi:ubiquinone/menaquinone biosynthesis C-methylase UbiE
VTFYEQRVLPHLVHWSMRQPTFEEYRSRVLQAAEGCVLEIGMGSGLNLPFYRDAVTHVIGLEPSPKLLSMARGACNEASQAIELLQASAEGILKLRGGRGRGPGLRLAPSCARVPERNAPSGST